MMHTAQALYDMLHKTMIELDKQIEEVRLDAERRIAVMPYPDITTPYMLKTPDGKFILADLMMAKLNCLASMANLKAAQDNVRTAGKK